MIDLDAPDCWPDCLAPQGDWLNRQSFSDWWQKHQAQLAHLDPRIAEQWVYRHWGCSPFMGLDLQRLAWRLERWTGERIIRDVDARFDQMDVDWDFRLFIEERRATGVPFLETGTWDFPIVVLETPEGILDVGGPRPDIRYVLIEGHLRRRCLNAVMAKGQPAAEHEIFVMTIVDPANNRSEAVAGGQNAARG